ncbi:WxL domain-containing protein [Carnobacterium maltaromaticum]|uniref:WxL domain-containing protein n=1 Tax=Carnobacterium maltaromaticum TaxID=2751 RepID=UPI00295E42DF|nr:WxL domain-containing protein [Carnobacterium maltaromaticum]
MKKLLAVLSVSTIGIIALETRAQAETEYPTATQAISEVDISIMLGDDGGPSIPPIDPEDPDLPPLPENPTPGELSLRYVSDINFGEIVVSSKSGSTFTKKDSNGVFPMATVQDFRNSSTRDGWQLTVKQDSEILPGGQIRMRPFTDELKIEVPSPVLTLNESNQLFANTVKEEGEPGLSGIYSIGMADINSNGVELFIPANVAVGDYSTSLTWNLISGPLD